MSHQTFPKEGRTVAPGFMRALHEIWREWGLGCEWPGCAGGCGHLELNHIEPRGRGGGFRRDTPDNLIMLGRRCHELAGKLGVKARARQRDAIKVRHPLLTEQIQEAFERCVKD
jgi:5-methylcytosine-specific restriction endonuclease McrA